MAAAFLFLARVARLGFLADFLSRSVLVGFLTGVGIQVAAGQIGALFGVPEGSGVTIAGVDFDNTVGKFVSTLGNLGDTNWTTVAVSGAVIVVILGARFVTTKVPGALIAVIGAIFFSWWLDLADDGVSTIGPVSGGLPSIGLPDVAWSDVPSLLGTAASIFILILAQSAATSRAYAAKYNEEFDENVDLVGLGAASAAAGLSGTFVVNGSPTKTQMGDDAGARSQIAQLTVGAVVVLVLLFFTVPLQYLPNAVLAAVVFIIGIKLVDAANMRKILRERPGEFAVATLTAATVVFVGVEQGIVLAIVASIVEHLRHAYRPATAVMAPDEGGVGFHSEPADPAARTAPGLVVYRFSSDLFYVNANHLMQDVTAFASSPEPIEWFCLDASAITDVDFTGARTLEQVHEELAEHGITLVVAEAVRSVREELDRYGLTEVIGRRRVPSHGRGGDRRVRRPIPNPAISPRPRPGVEGVAGPGRRAKPFAREVP